MTITRKKWFQLIAKVEEEDTSTYSAMMREINKNNPEMREEFMRKFKDAFDRAMAEGLEDHQNLALMEAKKSLGSDINYRMYKMSQLMSNNPADVGKTLAKIVKVILSKVPHDQQSAYRNIREKLMILNPSELSAQDYPATASYGQAITLIKTMLQGYDIAFIRQALTSLTKSLH